MVGNAAGSIPKKANSVISPDAGHAEKAVFVFKNPGGSEAPRETSLFMFHWFLMVVKTKGVISHRAAEHTEKGNVCV
jgi:hypothetical protein